MPIPESAELVRIPCQRCSREHFVYVHRATREALAYDGSGTRVLSGESLPTAFKRLVTRARATNAGASGTWSRTSSPVAWLSSPKPLPTARTAASAETEPARKIPGFGVTSGAHACRVPHAHKRNPCRQQTKLQAWVVIFRRRSGCAKCPAGTPIGGEARIPKPVGEVEAASAEPPALSSLAPAPAKPPYPSACACALMQPSATATMQLFGVNPALRWRSHRRCPIRQRLANAMGATPQSTQSPPNIGPTRRYV